MKKRKRRRLNRRRLQSPFLVKPYLQLGNQPQLGGEYESALILWHCTAKDHRWNIQYRNSGEAKWKAATNLQKLKLSFAGFSENYRFSVTLDALKPGTSFEYKLYRDGEPVFSSSGQARQARGQAFRYVIAGDLAEGEAASAKIAYQMSLVNPDLVIMAGDVTYKYGRFSEYLERFFPVYNADSASATTGAPLIRSRLSLSAFGNHDVAMPDVTDVPDFDWQSDILAQFILWSLPLNGPVGQGSTKHVPLPRGKTKRIEAFTKAAGSAFPRMANYSVDFGDSHWLVLDANVYMDWTDQKLKDWVDADLTAAKDTVWKFVCLHQPPFSSDLKHADEQRMRLLADLFEKHGVHVVFGGHYHAYERSYPLRFKIKPQPDSSLISTAGLVDGAFTLDKSFDGKTQAKPNGIVYIVTGAGGAKLYLNPGRRANQSALPAFTFKLVDEVHSFTCCDVSASEITFRQIDENGKEIDSFVIKK